MNPAEFVTDLVLGENPLAEEVKDLVPDQPQENGKRKRQMSEKQLKALAEGRKKRWLKKQEAKEEQKSSSSEEEDKSTEQSSSESEESKTETETEMETQTDYPSTAQESGEGTSSSAYTESSGQTDSSEEESESESEEEETQPPSPPVLRRQKATYKEQRNERAPEKMLKYIQARAQPYFNHMYV